MKDTTFDQLRQDGVLDFSDGYRTKRAELGTPGYRILRVTDVQDGRLARDGEDFVRVEHETRIGSKLSQPGDILLTTKGTVGRVATYPEEGETVVYSPQLCYFRVSRPDILNRRYLSYWFKSHAFQTQALHRANNTDMAPYISLRDIRTLRLTLPENHTQQAIAEVLGALDDKIAANDRIATTALSLSDSHFEKISAGLEGSCRTIGELAADGTIAVGDGYRTKRGEHGTPGLRILRAGDVKNFTISPNGEDYVSDEYRRQIGPKKSETGDILLTTKGTVGRTAVVPSNLDQVVYSPQVCYFRVTDHAKLNWGYLAGWFRSRDLKSQLAPLMFNSDMAPYINLQSIRSLRVTIPSREDQEKIGLLQSSLLARFDAVQAESRQLAKTRDELLPLLMSGKIRVRDAERTVEEVV